MRVWNGGDGGKEKFWKKKLGVGKCFRNKMKVNFLNLSEGKGTKEGKHSPSLEVQQLARVCIGNWWNEWNKEMGMVGSV